MKLDRRRARARSTSRSARPSAPPPACTGCARCSSCGSSPTRARAGASAPPWPRAPRSTPLWRRWRRPRSTAACAACSRPRRPGAVSCPAPPRWPQLFGSTAVDRMLAAAFEMAVADAELRAAGRSLAERPRGHGRASRRWRSAPSSGIPDGHDVGAAAPGGRRRGAGRRGPGAAEDRAGLGARAGARRAGRPPRPRAPGRRQRLLQHGRRGRGGAEPAWPSSTCSASSSRCRRPTWSPTRSWPALLPVPDLPRRVAHDAAAGHATRCATARAPWPA